MSKLSKKHFFEAGGGAIGNYENCSFSSEGIGTFKGNRSLQPCHWKTTRI